MFMLIIVLEVLITSKAVLTILVFLQASTLQEGIVIEFARFAYALIQIIHT